MNQDLRLHRAVTFVIERGLTDRPITVSLARELEAEGLIEIDVDSQLIELTRDIMRYAQRIAEGESGDILKLPICGRRKDEDNKVQRYWFFLENGTPDELAREWAARKRRLNNGEKRLERYVEACESVAGKREFRRAQARFAFMVNDPEAQEA